MIKFWIFFSLTLAALIINSSFFKSENIDKRISWFENQDKEGHFVFCAIFSWCLIKSFSQEIFLNHPILKGVALVHIFGVVIKIEQYFFTTDHDANFMDVLANGMGSVLIPILTYKYLKLLLLNPKIRLCR